MFKTSSERFEGLKIWIVRMRSGFSACQKAWRGWHCKNTRDLQEMMEGLEQGLKRRDLAWRRRCLWSWCGEKNERQELGEE